MTTSSHVTNKTTNKRPPIDLYKKITLVRNASDTVVYEDSEGVVQKISDLTGATAATLPPKIKLDIPVPRITAVEGYEANLSGDFNTSTSFIRNQEASDAVVKYTADEEDETYFLTHFGPYIEASQFTFIADSKSKTKGRPILTVSQFEEMMDLLERETGFNAIVSLSTAEQIFQGKKILSDNNIPSVDVRKTIVQIVYNYWVQKRSGWKKPLLRQYWPTTSPHDTNPHLVFRPREKEKYKLRKKRQDDIEAYKKLAQLRLDFVQVQNMLETVLKREEIMKTKLSIKQDIFEQRIYDCVDTSGLPRQSKLNLEEIEKSIKIPSYIQMQAQKKKRKREDDMDPSLFNSMDDGDLGNLFGANAPTSQSVILPNFMGYLPSREDNAVTSSNNGIPYVPSYTVTYPFSVQETVSSCNKYAHRPRIGRGGRLCIDRIPAHENHQTTYAYDNASTLANFNVDELNKYKVVIDARKQRHISEKISEICTLPLLSDVDNSDDRVTLIFAHAEDWMNSICASNQVPVWGIEQIVDTM